MEFKVSSFDHEELTYHHGLDSIPSIHSLFSKGMGALRNRISFYLWQRTGKKRVLTEDLKAAIRHMQECDVVVLAGGGYFNEIWKSMMWAQFATIALAKAAGTPVVICGQSVGPFSEKTLGSHLRKALKDVDLFACRDQKSLDIVQAAGASAAKCLLTADEVNLLSPLPGTAPRENNERIVVGVMVTMPSKYFDKNISSSSGEVRGKERFLTEVSNVLLGAKAKNSKIEFRIIPSTTYDEANCAEIYERLAAKVSDVFFVKSPNVQEYVYACQSVDVMFSTNMHPVIIASTANKPAISLSVHYKTASFMASIGLGDYCYQIDNYDVAEVTEKLNELIENRLALGSIIEGNREKLRLLACGNSSYIQPLYG
jgi:polysaccharide pyruvyl transferase WcaK-like protein